jgi:ketosteroid isomerase-like protein
MSWWPWFGSSFAARLASSSRSRRRGPTGCGTADIPRYFEDLAEAWHGYRAEPWDPVQGEDGKVACTLLVTAEAEQSGIKMEKRLGAVFTVRARKIVGIDAYPTRADALEAAGLRE